MAKAPTEIKSLARVHTQAAIRTLAKIINQPKASPLARIAAAVALLDRGWGKPVAVEHIGEAGNYVVISSEPLTSEE